MNFWPHHHTGPWRDAPPWAIELREMLSVVIKNQGANMSQVDDLTNAVATLMTSVTAHDAAVQAEIAALKAALTTSGAISDPAVATAIQNIASASATLANETAALTASLPPPSQAAPSAPTT